MANQLLSVHKIGLFRWEADVQIGHTVYSFHAWTRHRAMKNAELYKEN